MTRDDVTDIERWLRSVAAEMTTPEPGECLLCFMARQLDEFGCDCTLRFATRFRDLRVPRATALEQRLGQVGGFCDCEVFLNGFTLHPHWWRSEQEVEREDGWVELVEAQPPDRLPPCQGVSSRSTQPCTNWVRRGRW